MKAKTILWALILSAGAMCHAADVSRGGDLFAEGGFFTGCNYWAKNAGMYMWSRRDDSRDKGMPFFSKRGRRILVACYYDAKSLDGSVVWAKKALETPGADGIMYCTWCDKWELLGDWGDEMKRMAEEARRRGDVKKLDERPI